MTEHPPSIDVTTNSGLVVRIRQARRLDEPTLRAGFGHLSASSRYARFFTAVPQLEGSLLHSLIDLDGNDRLAFAVFDPSVPSEITVPGPAGSGDDGYGVAVARFVRSDPTAPTAELAVTIIDDYQGHGLGHLLLAGLVVAARRRGIERLQAFVLASNSAMVHLLQSHGADEVRLAHPDPAVRTFELDVAAPESVGAVDPTVVAAFELIA